MVRILSIAHTYLDLTSGDKTNENSNLLIIYILVGKCIHAVKLPQDSIHKMQMTYIHCALKTEFEKKTTAI